MRLVADVYFIVLMFSLVTFFFFWILLIETSEIFVLAEQIEFPFSYRLARMDWDTHFWVAH